MKQGTFKDAIKFVSGWSSTAGHAAYPKEYFIFPERLPWRKPNFLLQAVIN